MSSFVFGSIGSPDGVVKAVMDFFTSQQPPVTKCKEPEKHSAKRVPEHKSDTPASSCSWMSDGERFRFFYKGKAYLIPKDYIDDEHPGGGDEIWPWVNQDMTDAFDDADHSLDALEMLEEYLDEDYDPNEEQEKDAPREKEEEKAKEEEEKKAEASAPPLPPPSAAAAATPVSAPASAAPIKQDGAKISVAVKPEGETKSLLPVMASAAAAVVVLASVAVVMTKVFKKH